MKIDLLSDEDFLNLYGGFEDLWRKVISIGYSAIAFNPTHGTFCFSTIDGQHIEVSAAELFAAVTDTVVQT